MFKQSIYNIYRVVFLTFPVVWQKRTSIAYKHSWCSAFPELVINSLHHERNDFHKQYSRCIPIHHLFVVISPVSKFYIKLHILNIFYEAVHALLSSDIFL